MDQLLVTDQIVQQPRGLFGTNTCRNNNGLRYNKSHGVKNYFRLIQYKKPFRSIVKSYSFSANFNFQVNSNYRTWKMFTRSRELNVSLHLTTHTSPNHLIATKKKNEQWIEKKWIRNRFSTSDDYIREVLIHRNATRLIMFFLFKAAVIWKQLSVPATRIYRHFQLDILPKQ